MVVVERRQATVAGWDVVSGTGRVLLDDGVALNVPAGALRPGSARLLRRGQRVVVEIEDVSAPSVIAVYLLTVPPGREGFAASTRDDQPRTR